MSVTADLNDEADAQREPRLPSAFGTADLIRLAVPLALTVGCFSITLFTDRTLLMWHDPTASAASLSAGNLYWTIACIPVTALGFITPLIAMSIGDAKVDAIRSNRVWTLIWQGIWITVLAVPVFAAIGVFSASIFVAFGHATKLATQEARYFRILLLVAPAAMLESTLTAFFVARRITRPILLTNIASSIVNVVLDVWLIFGGLGLAAMGVRGAAIATATAMWFKVVVFASLLWRHRQSSSSSPSNSVWRPRLRVMGEIVLPGSALGIQQLIRSGFLSLVLVNIGAASVAGLAATSAALSLYQLLSIPAIGLATAITVFVGQSTAARDTTQIVPMVCFRCLKISLAVAMVIGLLLFAMPTLLIEIPMLGVGIEERNVIQPIAITLLQLASLYAVFDVSGMAFAGIIKGLGRTTPILVATTIAVVVALGVGHFTMPPGGSIVRHWWLVLIGWAIVQFVVLLPSIRRPKAATV